MRTLALLSLLLLVPGCFSPAEPAPTADIEGAAAPDALAAEATEPSAETTTVAPVAVSIAFSGTTPDGVCGPMGCQWASQGTEDFHPIAYTGHATHLAVQVTYADQRPGMEFYIGVCKGAAEDGSSACGEYTTGPSPLVVEFHVDTAEPVALSLGSLSTAAAPGGVMVFGASTFEVAGTLTVVPLA